MRNLYRLASLALLVGDVFMPPNRALFRFRAIFLLSGFALFSSLAYAQTSRNSTHESFVYELYLGNAAKPEEVFIFTTNGTATGWPRGGFGPCAGVHGLKYSIFGFWEIIYDGLEGPGSGGGCHNFSSTIDAGEVDLLGGIKVGGETLVIWRSIRYYSSPKNGVLKRIE